MKILFCLSLLTSISARKREVTFNDDGLLQVGVNNDFRNYNPDSEHNVVLPVPFGHIDIDGYGDLPNGLKQPVDWVELNMKDPTSEVEKRNYLKQKPAADIQFYDPDIYNLHSESKIVPEEPQKRPVNTDPTWIDYEKILYANNNAPPKLANPNIEPKTKILTEDTHSKNITNNEIENKAFNGGTFDLLPKYRPGYENWTTCDIFKGDPKFNPKDLIGVTWIPFYAWAQGPNFISYLHKFSFPTKQVVQEFKDEYGSYLSRDINWDEPKLLMTEDIDTLLIAGDRMGFFYAIHRQELPSNRNFIQGFKVHVLTMKFKIVQSYLAMMVCEEQYATLMAILGEDPQTDDDKRNESKVLNFVGKGYPIARDLEFEKLKKKEIQRLKLMQQENFVTINE